MENRKQVVIGFRWGARLLSLFVTAILCMFLFGRAEEQTIGELNELVGFVCFPIGVVVGFLFAWKQHWIGSSISIASLVAFCLWHFSRAGHWPSGPWFLIFTAPAFVFLAAAVLEKMAACSDH